MLQTDGGAGVGGGGRAPHLAFLCLPGGREYLLLLLDSPGLRPARAFVY